MATKTFGATSTTDEVLGGVDLSGKRVLVTGVSAGLGVETARALGVTTVALTGEGGGKLAGHSDILIDVPSRKTPIIQQLHICLYHYLCEKIEERLARWLLMADDRIDSEELPLTHEFLGLMLGTHRPGVTIALQALEKAGLITTRRSRGLSSTANTVSPAPRSTAAVRISVAVARSSTARGR